jgi:hypothetical protein
MLLGDRVSAIIRIISYMLLDFNRVDALFLCVSDPFRRRGRRDLSNCFAVLRRSNIVVPVASERRAPEASYLLARQQKRTPFGVLFVG